MFRFYYRSDNNPNVWHRCPWLLGDRERRSAGEIQDRSLAVSVALHHQPAGPRDIVRGLQTRVLGAGSICILLIEAVNLREWRDAHKPGFQRDVIVVRNILSVIVFDRFSSIAFTRRWLFRMRQFANRTFVLLVNAKNRLLNNFDYTFSW